MITHIKSDFIEFMVIDLLRDRSLEDFLGHLQDIKSNFQRIDLTTEHFQSGEPNNVCKTICSLTELNLHLDIVQFKYVNKLHNPIELFEFAVEELELFTPHQKSEFALYINEVESPIEYYLYDNVTDFTHEQFITLVTILCLMNTFSKTDGLLPIYRTS